MREYLEKERTQIDNPKNSWETCINKVGEKLCNLIIREYTFKQWNKEPEELDRAVLERLPVRYDFSEGYFTDKHQALPSKGYTSWVENMLDNRAITVLYATNFFDIRNQLKKCKVYYTGPIDFYFSQLNLPKLEYRSIHFEREFLPDTEYYQNNSVVNYPSKVVDFTRIVEYKHFWNQTSKHTVIVKEYTTDKGDPYYPVPNKKNQDLYLRYKEMALKERDVIFLGRLASYKYFDMDQAIKNSLDLFTREYLNSSPI
jgi:UDP-galactopyranose mutase